MKTLNINQDFSNNPKYKNLEFDENDLQVIDIDVDKEFSMLSQKLMLNNTTKHKKSNKTLLKIAAAAIILISLGTLLKFSFLGHNFTEIASNDSVLETKAENQTLITLNKNSYAKLIEKNHKFEVELKGEAYFDVEKNPNRTFQIKTNDLIVTVKGTEFNVAEIQNQTKVTVVGGKVEVNVKNNKQKFTLTKNEELIYDKKSNKVFKHTIDNENFLSWKSHKLNFKNNTLKEITQTLSKYYDVKFVFSSKDIENLRMSGCFINQDIESILNVMKNTLNVDFKLQGNTYTISKL